MIRSVIAVIVVVLCFHDLGVVALPIFGASLAGSPSRTSFMNSLPSSRLVRSASAPSLTGWRTSSVGLATVPRPLSNPTLSNSAANTASLMRAQQAAKTVQTQTSVSVLGKPATLGQANSNAGGKPPSYSSTPSNRHLPDEQQQLQFLGGNAQSVAPKMSTDAKLAAAGMALSALTLPALVVPQIISGKQNAERQEIEDKRYVDAKEEETRRYLEQKADQEKILEEQKRIQNATTVEQQRQFDVAKAFQEEQTRQLLAQSQGLADSGSGGSSVSPAAAPPPAARSELATPPPASSQGNANTLDISSAFW